MSQDIPRDRRRGLKGRGARPHCPDCDITRVRTRKDGTACCDRCGWQGKREELVWH